ncbi:MAG TPA: APC family permease [Ktedonobacteraceae bacterium]
MVTYNQQPEQTQPVQSLEGTSLPSEDYIVRVMPPILGTFDMTAIFLMAIFWITSTTVAATAGPAAITYLVLIGITFFIPRVIATAQLGVLFPHEGSVYNWTHRTLGPYWSFFVGFCFWFPSVLAIVSGADALVTYLQGLNHKWLIEPWQQGLVIILIIAFSGILATRRFRMVQNMVNMVVGLIFVAVFLIGLSLIIWHVKGNPSATNFSHLSDWSPNNGNFFLFGLITFVYIGTNIPLNMGGEIVGAGNDQLRRRKVITRHLLWGSLIAIASYLLTMFALLVIRGSQNVAQAPILSFEWVNLVSAALGRVAGIIFAVCLMSFFLMASVVYNSALARLLLVGAIDQRLPVQLGKLNKNRVPANAIIFQTIIAIVFTATVFMVIPSITRPGNPVDLATEVFNVSLASLTLVWTFGTIFFFIDLRRVYVQDRQAFHKKRIFPRPVLWFSIVVGPVACLITIYDTLANSWIPQITNDKWWFIVGGLTLIFILIASVASMFATNEVHWEKINRSDR